MSPRERDSAEQRARDKEWYPILRDLSKDGAKLRRNRDDTSWRPDWHLERRGRSNVRVSDYTVQAMKSAGFVAKHAPGEFVLTENGYAAYERCRPIFGPQVDAEDERRARDERFLHAAHALQNREIEIQTELDSLPWEIGRVFRATPVNELTVTILGLRAKYDRLLEEQADVRTVVEDLRRRIVEHGELPC